MEQTQDAWTIIMLIVGAVTGSLWVFVTRKDENKGRKPGKEGPEYDLVKEMLTLFAGFLLGSIFGAILAHAVLERWNTFDVFTGKFIYAGSSSVCTLLSGGVVNGIFSLKIGNLLDAYARKRLGIGKDRHDT